jgi:glyoxylase-like metal-dependent hydrolase (beta-lactamase superfamily II)
MNISERFAIAVAFGLAATIALATSAGSVNADPPSMASPEIAYLKEVNGWRPTADPQLLFLLMAEFSNAGRQVEGIDYFEHLLREFGPALAPAQRAQYMVAIASLRAGRANDVFLLRRIGWVRDTLAMLDEANRITGSSMFVGRWMSGVVRSQVPGFFGERDQARADLQWCIQNVDKAPHAGWLREVYFALAKLDRQSGDTAGGARNQSLSGYTEESRPVVLTTPFSGDVATGHKFSPKVIREVVPGSVYALSGFEFTEYYFVVTADHKQLVSIDAGTRADSAQAALDALKQRVPGLPPLTTVFVTHAHWDHVGGQAYFRKAYPEVRFIGRSNYQSELEHDAGADITMLKHFFGEKFSMADVLGYRANVLVDRPIEMTVGGTRFALAPTRGGETEDAMLIHMPDVGVAFVGDILMPYIGAPFVEEGSVDGMLAAIDQLNALSPRILLHGHEPLTRIFASSTMLVDLKSKLVWLRDEVVRMTKTGSERSAIHESNLTAPGLDRSTADVHLAYLVLRENIIDRLFDQNTGYWQSGVKGLDHLSDAERGSVLTDYLKVSEGQVREAAERMMEEGRHELAASTLQAWRARNPGERGLDVPYRQANLKLMEKYQEFNPFKFIVYGAQAQQATAQMDRPHATTAQLSGR